MTLLYRASDAAGLVLRAELEAIARERRAALHFLLGPSDGAFDPSRPARCAARARTRRPRRLPVRTARDGPRRDRLLLRAGVPASRIHSEDFDHA
ncbi:hypothetical protein O1L60_12035 [Streptomyces diastatochromogenes]|nr:hypothetical protein [Streptomyces diastatochromogenes]